MQAQLALVESALTSVYSPGAPSHERKSAEQTLQAFCDSLQSWDLSLTALSSDRYQLWHLFFAQHLQRCCVGVAKGKLPWGAPDHGVKVQHAQQLLALLQASITPQRAAPVVKTLARATAHAALSVPAMLLAVVQHACAHLACETTCIVLHEVGQAVAELRSWAGKR